MLKKNPLIFLLALFSIIANAQTESKQPANMFSEKLPNGMEILVVEDHTVPLVTLDMTFKAGAINETGNINGLISLYGALMLRGNKIYAASEYGYKAGGLGLRGG